MASSAFTTVSVFVSRLPAVAWLTVLYFLVLVCIPVAAAVLKVFTLLLAVPRPSRDLPLRDDQLRIVRTFLTSFSLLAGLYDALRDFSVAKVFLIFI